MKMILNVTDSAGKKQEFHLAGPVSVSREVLFSPKTKSPNAFHLPPIQTKTVEYEGQFIGDVKRGGSCNVDVLSYVPHGLTHIETAAHILNTDTKPFSINDIPPENLHGIVYLIDLAQYSAEPGAQIPWEPIETKLKQNRLPISMLALKTTASLLPQDYDFSGKNFLSLSPNAALGIHDYRFYFPGSSKVKEEKRIDCLLLDLPSIDPEKDEGKLSDHRRYFGIPLTGHNAVDSEKRTIVELAWFSHLNEGYYYAVITPPRFQTHAVTTGIFFYPLNHTPEPKKPPIVD